MVTPPFFSCLEDPAWFSGFENSVVDAVSASSGCCNRPRNIGVDVGSRSLTVLGLDFDVYSIVCTVSMKMSLC